MQYVILIYESEAEARKRSDAEQRRIMQDYGAFAGELGRAGKIKGGEPLEPIATATTVRVRDGKTLVTDGPFAETREQLGGFFLIEAANLDEATAIAAKVPSVKFGSIEIRPVRKISMP
jgi:hypothetical protein